MKKINILLAILAVFTIWSCEPLEEELDQIESEFKIVKNLSLVLSEDDYEIADEECECAGSNNFGSIDDAKEYIPLILAQNYPALGEGSSAIVGFDLYVGGNESVDPYLDADSYTLTSADYQVAGAEAASAKFFTEEVRAQDFMSEILNNQIANPEDDQLIATSYRTSDASFSEFSLAEYFNDGDLGEMMAFSISGDFTWRNGSSSSGYNYAGMSAFSDGSNQPNEDWLITPKIDLTARSNGTSTLRVNQVLAFLGDGEIGTDIAVLVSTDFDESDPEIATWDNVTSSFDRFPTGANGDFDRYETKLNLASYEGSEIHIAFYYKSTVDYGPNWRIDNIRIDNGVPITTISNNVFYQYDEATSFWSEVTESVYFLSSADFGSMGLTNFGSSVSPDNYLPQFLKTLLPYAQEEDEQVVIYDYVSSSSGAQVRGDFYTFENGEWSKHEFVTESSFSFGYNETGWVPDNTIKLSLGSDAWTSIGKAYEDINPEGSASALQYSNFDISLWTSEQIFEAITNYLEETVPSVDGQKYLVSYAIWKNPGAGTGTLYVIYSDAEGGYILFEE